MFYAGPDTDGSEVDLDGETLAQQAWQRDFNAPSGFSSDFASLRPPEELLDAAEPLFALDLVDDGTVASLDGHVPQTGGAEGEHLAVYRGFLNIAADDVYSFRVDAPQGAIVSIMGQEIARDGIVTPDQPPPAFAQEGAVILTAGPIEIEVRALARDGGAPISVLYSGLDTGFNLTLLTDGVVSETPDPFATPGLEAEVFAFPTVASDDLSTVDPIYAVFAQPFASVGDVMDDV